MCTRNASPRLRSYICWTTYRCFIGRWPQLFLRAPRHITFFLFWVILLRHCVLVAPVHLPAFSNPLLFVWFLDSPLFSFEVLGDSGVVATLNRLQHYQCLTVQTRCNTSSPGVWRTDSSLNRTMKTSITKARSLQSTFPNLSSPQKNQMTCTATVGLPRKLIVTI